jgi:hypothetical protein
MNNQNAVERKEFKAENTILEMKKTTKVFIGTLAGALLGSAVLGIKQVLDWVTVSSQLLANILPLVGLISGGVVGYYVARNS